jgi:HSP20 family protein
MSEVKVEKGQSLAKREQREGIRPSERSTSWLPSSRFLSMSPFGLMREFTDEMDRMFHGWGEGQRGAGWSPTVDVRRCDGTMVIAAELPGLHKEEVKVELTNDTLVIEGERKREHQDDHEGFHRYERSYGHFYRSIPLPEGADTNHAKAELRDGVLKVSVPVPQTRKEARQIPIEEGRKGSPSGGELR